MTAPPNPSAALGRLALASTSIALVWLGLLPRIGAVAPVARHVRRMEEGGINPAAMVYTELERLPLRPAWIESHLSLWRLPDARREAH